MNWNNIFWCLTIAAVSYYVGLTIAYSYAFVHTFGPLPFILCFVGGLALGAAHAWSFFKAKT